MASAKDYWNIDPAMVNKVAFKTPQPSMSYDYTPAAQDLTLTEALDKPLYEFSESELHDLVAELKSVRWAEKEQQVRRITHEFMMQYRTHANPSIAFQRNVRYLNLELPVQGFRQLPPQPAGATIPSTVVSSARSIRISIPVSIPSEYVHAFVERMVRDYFEEG